MPTPPTSPYPREGALRRSQSAGAGAGTSPFSRVKPRAPDEMSGSRSVPPPPRATPERDATRARSESLRLQCLRNTSALGRQKPSPALHVPPSPTAPSDPRPAPPLPPADATDRSLSPAPARLTHPLPPEVADPGPLRSFSPTTVSPQRSEYVPADRIYGSPPPASYYTEGALRPESPACSSPLMSPRRELPPSLASLRCASPTPSRKSALKSGGRPRTPKRVRFSAAPPECFPWRDCLDYRRELGEPFNPDLPEYRRAPHGWVLDLPKPTPRPCQNARKLPKDPFAPGHPGAVHHFQPQVYQQPLPVAGFYPRVTNLSPTYTPLGVSQAPYSPTLVGHPQEPYLGSPLRLQPPGGPYMGSPVRMSAPMSQTVTGWGW